MLNKRIKSLLVAGLLVVSMSGMAFAAETELPKESTSKIENPIFTNGKHETSLQGGLIKVEMSEKENGDVDIKLSWDSKIKIKGVRTYYVNAEDAADQGSIDHTNYFETWYKCNTLAKEGDFNVGTVAGGIEGKKLVRIEIDFENLAKNSVPVTPLEPAQKVTDPETGDASMIAVVGIAVASAVGLYTVSKNDDEE